MTRISSFTVAVAASVCLLPLSALAQTPPAPPLLAQGPPAPPVTSTFPTAAEPSGNWVSIGSQYNSDRSYYLGRYSGAVGPGFYGLGDFHLGQRDPWDSGGTFYSEANGANLGFYDRSFDAKVGQQGTWGLGFSYQGIPYYATDNFHSIWTNNGALAPGLGPSSATLLPLNNFPSTPLLPSQPPLPGLPPVASVWVPTPSSKAATSLFGYNLSTQRNIFAGTGKWEWGDWTITGSISHDHKTGFQANSLEIGGTVGLTVTGTTSNTKAPAAGVTSGLGFFAQPIDYDMDRYNLIAAYSTPQLQVQVGYTFSQFIDNNTVFNAQNPFAFGAPNASGSGFTGSGVTPAGITAPYVLPPSNSEHQVKVLLGYNISPTMRVNANFSYSLGLQNSSFVLGTGFPGNNPAEPRSSFDGVMQSTFGNIALTAEPLPKLGVRVAYTIDNRNNQSPSNLYVVNARSSASNTGDSDCAINGFMCMNLPFSYQHQKIEAAADYRLMAQTKISLTDSLDSVYRTFANTSLVTSNTITAKVRSLITEDVYGSLSYSHQDRVAHNYTNGVTWSQMTGTGVEGDITGFVAFFEASRTRDEVKAALDVSPTNNLTTSLIVKFNNDRYPEGTYGLRNNHNLILGPDISWQPLQSVTAHAYYTYQQIFYDQNSLYQTGGYNVPWTLNTTDSVQTFGATVDWQAIPDTLKLGLEYNLSYGDTAYAMGDSVIPMLGTLAITSPTLVPSVTIQPLPDIKTFLNIIGVHGEYKFRPNMAVLFGYAWERFSYKDFMQGTSTVQYANALLPGTTNSNDSVHVVGAALRIRF
jgi:MtrB/PioB family decaheme-associated outer membrane protein